MAIILSKNLFGPITNRFHKSIKELFAFQNHLIKPPPKIIQIEGCRLSYANGIYISTNLDAWCCIYIFEIVVRFKGRHEDKKMTA